jgi:hypothetical protein
MKYFKLKKIGLRNHPQCTEKWLQSVIADDPSVLGLGDLVLKDRERLQPRAGRLDLLLQEADGSMRYEVEIQLGPTDESHIIRTIEYWDLERKRYPQYEHTAVLIAEDITSRFFNVIGLFNGFIPIMALQISAIETAEGIGLDFIKILDTMSLGMLDEDEEISETTDRNFWETKRGTPKTVKLADRIFEMAKGIVPNIEQSYNKHYIGFWVDGKPCNFAICRPKKSFLRLEIGLPQSEEYDGILDDAGVDVLDYDRRWRKYRVNLTADDINKHKETLEGLLREAYQLRA